MTKQHKGKKPVSNAMMSRIASLEAKLKSKLRGPGRKKQQPGKHSSPAGPGNTRSRARGGALGLGSGVSGVTNRKSQIISEDEYIGEIYGSVEYATTAYSVNPGQAGTFPWGNKIASLYEEYDFTKLEFYYKREVSEFATNGQAGKVILSFDYNASSPPPATKQQVEDMVPHQDGMPCTPVILLSVDCSRIRKNSSKFVRTGAQPANTDIKTYDAGNLFVSTQGNTNTNLIGELRVRYTCKLQEPVLIGDATSLVYGHLHTSGTSTSLGPWTGATVPSQEGLTITTPTLSSVLIDGLTSGVEYLLDYFIESSSLATSPTLSITSGGSFTNTLDGDAVGEITYADGGSGAGILATILSTGAPLLLSMTGGGGTAFGYADFLIDSLGSLFSSRYLATHRGLRHHLIQQGSRVSAVPASCSSASSSSKVDLMYAKLLQLGYITEDESPVMVAGDDGVGVIDIRDRRLGISTSAPPLSAGLSKVAALRQK
jgi:hypothetical protein